jgi:hypothetical protein
MILMIDPAEESDSASSTRADIARDLNRAIWAIADGLPADSDAERLTFYCECGCLAEVKLSLTEYGRNGARADGHFSTER